MREFFLNLLNNLDKLAGLKQLDKIYAAHEKESDAKKEINILLTVLCDVSKQFPFIPEYEQQKIISHAVISDPEFMSLNGSIIYKWLAKNKDRFFKESHHVDGEEKQEGPPLTGEARAAKLDEWLKSLASTEQMIIAKIDKKDIAREGKEWASEIERKAVSTTPDPDRKVYTKESLKERNERIRAMQEKAFRDRNPGASEDEVKLFMIEAKRHEVPIPLTQEKTDIKTN